MIQTASVFTYTGRMYIYERLHVSSAALLIHAILTSPLPRQNELHPGNEQASSNPIYNVQSQTRHRQFGLKYPPPSTPQISSWKRQSGWGTTTPTNPTGPAVVPQQARGPRVGHLFYR
ncbi:hypothetical protein XENTR_v10010753 [Xenopus tropicalis]|nr:hypothetical protein XENTR_v10010753 [Xenopus tropicalis]